MIETARLRLRNWREGDAALLHLHCNTEPVMRWLGGVKPAAFMEDVAGRLAEWQELHGHTLWVVERKEDGAFLGFCGLKIGDDPGSPIEGEIEIAWRLREDAWGKGYAREGAAASLEHAFGTLAAKRVVAVTVEGNAPSWGLMERLGMTRRPDLDYSGAAWAEGPVIAYAIGREEWAARSF